MCWDTFRWAKGVMLDPKRNTKKELDYGPMIRKLLVVSLVPGVMFTILTVFAADLAGNEFAGFGAWSGLFYIPLFLLSAVINPFVNGAITHFFGKIVFKLMKKDYRKTYNAYGYGMIPAFIVGWIPFIGSLVGGVWSIVVNVYAISNQHNVKPSRALLIVLIPVIIAFAFAFLVAGAVFSMFNSGMFGGFGPMMPGF